MTNNISIIILGAGKGTRMKSSLPKVMHKIAGREMINLVIDEALKLEPQELVIVASQDLLQLQDKIKSQHNFDIKFALQENRLGTANAAKIGFEALEKQPEKILILYADTPLIQEDTMSLMIEEIEDGNAICVLAFENQGQNEYGRLVLNEDGNLEKIVEFKEANEEELEIELCNSGVMAFEAKYFADLLSLIKNENSKQEFYLTDIIAIARQSHLDCGFVVSDEAEVLGVNSRLELSRVEALKQYEMRMNFMENGVSLLDPGSIYFSYDTKIENDVVIHPNVVFGVGVEVLSGCEIKSFCHLEGVKINNDATVGPFARIRSNSEIGSNVHIGNFVEVKNSVIKNDTKANHLAYIGDSEIGRKTNIGAGVITCNYDGYKKHKTKIGDNVFVGSNCALVAPIAIADDVLIGAGSVITKDVASGDLAVSRSKQIVIENGATKYHQRKNSKKNG